VIYLDHHAATPLCAAARRAMAAAAEHAWANPASVHRAGREARALLERARGQLAESLRAQPADLVLASGGTEACNLAVFGFGANLIPGEEVLTTSIEHPAIERALASLEARGVRVIRLNVPAGAPPSKDELSASLGPKTRLAVLQWVNHETGSVLPIADYAGLCAARGVPVVVDACQAYGKRPIDVSRLPVDALIVASSKVGGPGGAAALWLARQRQLTPLLHGGAQERGRRPGTPHVAALVGFGAAAAELGERLEARPRLGALRDRLEQAARALGGQVNGAAGERVETVTNLSFPGWRAEVLVAALDIEGLCVSAGAACSSGLGAPSPVLRAMYPAEPWRAEAALRFSLGPETTEAEVEAACTVLARVLGRARA
jgi:cysteine desulfurase